MFLLQLLGCRDQGWDAASCMCEMGTQGNGEEDMRYMRRDEKILQMNRARKLFEVESRSCMYEPRDGRETITCASVS